MTFLLLTAVVVLIFVNGFFVAAEFALVRSRPSQLEEKAKEGSKTAALALRQTEEMPEYLSACQFGITLASLGIGFLGEPAIATRVEPLLGDWLSHTVATAVAIAFAYVVVTFGHITVGEQAPKVFAIANAEAVARRVARPLEWFNILMRPAIAILNHVSNGLLRLFGVNASVALEGGETPEELRLLIARAHVGGQLDPGEAGMLEGVFHLHEQEARQVMTPIPAVVTVDVSEDAQTALMRGVDSGHTRLLVTEDFNPDRLRGIVHTNALARRLVLEGPHASIEPLVREAPIVPETKPLDDLLSELQLMRTEIAIVADEYGRVVGIVTVEDIVEEVVGEIEEAFGGGAEDRQPDRAIRRLPNGDFFVRGHVPVTDLADHGVELPADEGYNSVGGLVFDQLGRLPKRGDVIDVDGYSIRVESVRENRVEAVRIRERRVEQPAAHDAPVEER